MGVTTIPVAESSADVAIMEMSLSVCPVRIAHTVTVPSASLASYEDCSHPTVTTVEGCGL